MDKSAISKSRDILGGRRPGSQAGSGKHGLVVKIGDSAASWLGVTSQLCRLCCETLAEAFGLSMSHL